MLYFLNFPYKRYHTVCLSLIDFISLSIMPSKAIHVDANGKILFFLWLSSEIHHIFFIHSSVDGYVGCFRVLATVNNATVNTGVHVSFQMRVLIFPEYNPRSGTAGSYGGSVFNFLRSLHTVLRSGCTDSEKEITLLSFL